MNKSAWTRFIIVITLGALTLSYNNCSKKSESSVTSIQQSSVSASDIPLSGNICEDDLLRLFANGYHKFLTQTCSTCHAQGPGKGQFANSDITVAYRDFNQIGYTKISTNAASPSHNPPYTGAQNITIVNDLKLEWEKGQEDYAKCKGMAALPPPVLPLEERITYELKAQTVPALNLNEEQEMVWTINQDLIRINGTGDLPNLPNAKFSLKIAKHKTGGGDEYYTLRAPTLWGSEVDAHIAGLHGKINGFLVKNSTTFSYVDADIRAGSKDDASGLITTGALVIPGVTFSTDKISIDIEDLKAVTLPPPPPPLTVTFAGDMVQWTPSTVDKVANVDVILSSAPVDPVSVSVVEDSANICGLADPVDLSAQTGCLPEVTQLVCPTKESSCIAGLKMEKARSVIGTTYNRFDWDYKFQSTTLVFLPGETKKTIQITFSKDIRKENNRLLSLSLELGYGDLLKGSNSKKYFVIDKVNNPVPPLGVARFQDLMHPINGILYTNCIECHNSIKLEGQYDITNYDLMIQRGVLVPGSTTSKMYRRIDPTDPEWTNLLGMPRTGPMEDIYIREVRKWIEAGAPNN
ncbi:MAG: hypothetical protein ACXWRZ_13550 [Bdellovibrio sp.]